MSLLFFAVSHSGGAMPPEWLGTIAGEFSLATYAGNTRLFSASG